MSGRPERDAAILKAGGFGQRNMGRGARRLVSSTTVGIWPTESSEIVSGHVMLSGSAGVPSSRTVEKEPSL